MYSLFLINPLYLCAMQVIYKSHSKKEIIFLEPPVFWLLVVTFMLLLLNFLILFLYFWMYCRKKKARSGKKFALFLIYISEIFYIMIHFWCIHTSKVYSIYFQKLTKKILTMHTIYINRKHNSFNMNNKAGIADEVQIISTKKRIRIFIMKYVTPEWKHIRFNNKINKIEKPLGILLILRK